MNQFAGVIPRVQNLPDRQSTDEWIAKLVGKFPSETNDWKTIHTGQGIFCGQLLHFYDTNAQKDFIFSGILYNQFEIASNCDLNGQTHADTAALVSTVFRKFGQKGMESFNGRFVIIVCDRNTGDVQLYSDQMGVQQVFLHIAPEFVIFGSSIKYLLNHSKCPAQIDWYNALKHPVPFIVMDGEQSYNAWFKDIDLMPEGHCASFSTRSNQFSIKPYWNPFGQNYSSTDFQSTTEVMDAYMNLLEDAVRIRSNEFDESFAFLSGGLDSSIICALAAKYSRVNTFSIVTQTTMLEGTTGLIHSLSQQLGLKNTQFVIPFHQLSFDEELWKKRIWLSESPFNHSDAFTKTLLHYGITQLGGNPAYVLTGTGSDQLNGGLARWIVKDLNDPQTNWTNLKNAVRDESLKKCIPERLYAMWGARNILTHDFIHHQFGSKPEENAWEFYVKSNLHINRFTLMWDENRAAASENRSIRYPFLDYRFVPFILSVPEVLQAGLFFDKQILRHPSVKHLPDFVINKPKAPAETGKFDHRKLVYEKLAGNGYSELIEAALGPESEPHPVVDKAALKSTIKMLQNSGDIIGWEYVFNVINLGLLEQLGTQSEQSMRFEYHLTEPLKHLHSWNPVISNQLYKEMGIPTEAEILNMPLSFASNSSLMEDSFTGIYYLMKNEILEYEIEPENHHWILFLSQVNGKSSALEIAEKLNISIQDIKDYLFQCLKEGILETQTP